MAFPVPGRTLEELTAVEQLAEEILRDRSEVVALERRRNESRVALRTLSKGEAEGRVWLAVGPVLMRVGRTRAASLLTKDQTATAAALGTLQSDLKVRLARLRDLEYQEPLPGFHLSPLSTQERSALSPLL